MHPDGVEVDSEGNVWVLDEGNSRVQRFDQEAGSTAARSAPEALARGNSVSPGLEG
jgi:sugar lactone lactonase YvrE